MHSAVPSVATAPASITASALRPFWKSVCLHLLALLLISLPPIAECAAARPDKRAIQKAVEEGRFDSLEQTLAALNEESKGPGRDDRVLNNAFNAFESTDPVMTEKLAAWAKAAPGSALAHKTSEERFARMRQFFAEAENELRAALAADPELSIAYAAQIRLGKHDFRTPKEATLKEALRHCPGSFAVRYAYLFELQPKWGGSFEAMSSFIAALPPDKPGLVALRGFEEYTLGDQLVIEQRYAEALPHFAKALAKGMLPVYYAGQARALRETARYDEALSQLDTGLMLFPENVALLEERAEVYIKLDKLDPALADLDLARALDPLDPRTLRTRARVYEKKGRYADALADYRKSLVYGHDHAATYLHMGWIQAAKNKDYVAASAAYQQAAELEPGNLDYWYRFATAMHQRRECETRYPLVRYQRLCAAHAHHESCNAERLQWAEKTLKFLSTTPACAKVTDDTRPEIPQRY